MCSLTVVIDSDRALQKSLLAELFEPGVTNPPFTKELPAGCRLIFKGFPIQKSASHGIEEFRLILAISRDVLVGAASGVIANWLSAKFQSCNIAKLRTITRTFDKHGVEVLNVTEIETSPEKLSEIIYKVVDKNLESDEFF